MQILGEILMEFGNFEGFLGVLGNPRGNWDNLEYFEVFGKMSGFWDIRR